MAKSNDKEIILTEIRERVTDQGSYVSLSGDFSAQTFQARREWYDKFKVIKEKETYNQEYFIQHG